MTSFTKGKWLVDNDAWGVYSNHADCYIALMGAFHTNEEKEANARLIAEAPEMENLIRELAALPDEQCMISNLILTARKIIARIDGTEDKS